MLAFCMHIENSNNYISNLIFDLIKTNHGSLKYMSHFLKMLKGYLMGSGKLLSNKKYKTSDS